MLPPPYPKLILRTQWFFPRHILQAFPCLVSSEPTLVLMKGVASTRQQSGVYGRERKVDTGL